MFALGLSEPPRVVLGQLESIISAVINAGLSVYKIRSEEERAEDDRKFKEKLANQAAARETEALRIQQEAIKAQQAALQPQPGAAGVPGAPGAQGAPSQEKILGMSPGTFFTAAGLTAATLLGATYLMTRKK